MRYRRSVNTVASKEGELTYSMRQDQAQLQLVADGFRVSSSSQRCDGRSGNAGCGRSSGCSHGWQRSAGDHRREDHCAKGLLVCSVQSVMSSSLFCVRWPACCLLSVRSRAWVAGRSDTCGNPREFNSPRTGAQLWHSRFH